LQAAVLAPRLRDGCFAVCPSASVWVKDKTATDALTTRKRIFMFGLKQKVYQTYRSYNNQTAGLANRLIAKS